MVCELSISAAVRSSHSRAVWAAVGQVWEGLDFPRCQRCVVAEVDQDNEEDLLVTEQMSVSEVEQILEDLANGVVDEILPRLSEEDVAFDTDEVVVEEEVILDDDDDDDSDADDDEKDIGWISEEE